MQSDADRGAASAASASVDTAATHASPARRPDCLEAGQPDVAGGVLVNLHVEGFRNLASQDIALHERLTVFVGDNAQGKTNILEAACLLTGLPSPRRVAWPAMIARTAAHARIHGTLSGGNELSIAYQRDPVRTRWQCNGVACTTARLTGLMPLVAFVPQDLHVFAGDPGGRRALIDNGLVSWRPGDCAHAGVVPTTAGSAHGVSPRDCVGSCTACQPG